VDSCFSFPLSPSFEIKSVLLPLGILANLEFFVKHFFQIRSYMCSQFGWVKTLILYVDWEHTLVRGEYFLYGQFIIFPTGFAEEPGKKGICQSNF